MDSTIGDPDTGSYAGLETSTDQQIGSQGESSNIFEKLATHEETIASLCTSCAGF